MEKKTLRSFPPCPVFDTEGMESWLSDMAKEGWLLTDQSLFFGYFIFQKFPPQTAHYRLEVKSRTPHFWEDTPNAPSEESQAICEEMGWWFVLRHREFDIYKSTDPAPRELHTDPEIQALTLKMLSKRLWKGLFHLLLLALFHVTFGVFAYPFSIIMVMGSVFYLTLTVLALSGLVNQISAIHRIHQLRKRLLSGKAWNRAKDWRTGARRYRVMQFMSLCLSFCIFLYIFAIYFDSKMEIPLSGSTGTVPFVTLEQLAPEGEHVTLDKIDNGSCEVWSAPLYPVIFDYLDGGTISMGDGTGTGGLLEVQYCEARSPWLAFGAAKDFARFYQNNIFWNLTEGEIRPLPELDLDYAVGFYNQFGLIRVVLAEGNTAVCARFSMDDGGHFTMEHWTEMMAERLKGETGVS